MSLWASITSASAASFQFQGDTSSECAECHADITTAWQGSRHAKAMQTASPQSVLGAFDGTPLIHAGEQSIFTSNGKTFEVEVLTSDKSRSHKILYTFGVFPLQQYLVETKNGKLQALPWAWDSRPAPEGGQRWFHLYEADTAPPTSRTHWQQPLQNWNGMCADCHSTALKRNYSPASDTFKTRAQAINVACAACHGDGADHATVARAKRPLNTPSTLQSFRDSKDTRFERAAGERTASNHGASHTQKEIGVCASCHSLRTPLTDVIDPRRVFLDQFAPSLLDEGLYYADGQIQEEVYVWGSFMQSKMAAAGVTCTHCHNAHSLKLKHEGNALCTTCHAPQVFDAPAHHRHKLRSTGALCVNCHMPATTYMGVDARRDHSFKIPRPDLSRDLGTPNACTTCHETLNQMSMDPETAAAHIKTWYPDPLNKAERPVTAHIRALAAARMQNPASREPLRALIEDENVPAITRATALSLVPALADTALLSSARAQLAHPDALMRIGAIRALTVLPQEQRAIYLAPLLGDPLKAVRLEAARALMDVPPAVFSGEAREAFKAAVAETIKANQQVSWRGEGRANSALLHQGQGNINKAISAYRQAIAIDPAFVPAWVNLSELLRARGQTHGALNLLVKGLEATSGAPSVHHALGLAYIRRNKFERALIHLQAATDLGPDDPRFAYVHAVALHGAGHREDTWVRLSAALDRHPFDPDLLTLALALASQDGDAPQMRRFAERLSAIFPEDPAYQDLKTRPLR